MYLKNNVNILVVSSKYPPEYSGSGLRAHNTYQRLMKKYGLYFDVLTSSEEYNGVKKYYVNGISVLRISLKSFVYLFSDRNDNVCLHWLKKVTNHFFYVIDYWFEAIVTILWLICRAWRYDLIHVFGKNNVTSAVLSYAKVTKKPCIVEFVNLSDNPHQYEPLIVKLICGKGLPKHSLIICLSEYLKQVCLKYRYSNDQLWCRPNPVDETKYYYESIRKSALDRGFFGMRDGEIMVLHLAKFIPRKQQLFMVDVLNYLPDNYRLILAGPLIQSGPLLLRDQAYFESIVARVQELGLDGRVCIYPKFLDEPQIFLKMADVFVLPSTDEAFGTPFMEALACGIPVVTNDIPGVFDQWIRPGEDGFICELDAKKWAECIMRAVHIEHDKMRASSCRILDRASTKLIDAQYYDHICRLIGQDK